MRRYEDTCAACVARYEGYVFQRLGDGIVAFLGYPLAHEAERAIRAGLEIIESLSRLDVLLLDHRQLSDAKDEHARRRGHPFDLGFALSAGADVFEFRGEPDKIRKRDGKTWSTRWAAVSAMPRALQDGHTPRPLQEKAIRKSCPHSPQRARAKP